MQHTDDVPPSGDRIESTRRSRQLCNDVPKGAHARERERTNACMRTPFSFGSIREDVGTKHVLVQLGGFSKDIERGAGAKGTLHVRVDDLQAENITRVDPAEPIGTSQTVSDSEGGKGEKRRKWRRAGTRGGGEGLTLLGPHHENHCLDYRTRPRPDEDRSAESRRTSRRRHR